MPGAGLPFAGRMFAVLMPSWIRWMRHPAEGPAGLMPTHTSPRGKLTFVPQRRPARLLRPISGTWFWKVNPLLSQHSFVSRTMSPARRSSACVLAPSSLCASSDRGAFSCADCSRVVTSPGLRRHLQVFLACPARPQCTVRVKLMQSSISSLLRFAAGEDGGYEVNSVIGKEVGWLNCFVQSITTHPTSCLGLEEIELLGERASSGTTASPGRL